MNRNMKRLVTIMIVIAMIVSFYHGPAGKVSAAVNCKLNVYFYDATVKNNGTVVAYGETIEASSDKEITLEAVPDSGYIIQKWVLNGTVLSDKGKVKFKLDPNLGDHNEICVYTFKHDSTKSYSGEAQALDLGEATAGYNSNDVSDYMIIKNTGEDDLYISKEGISLTGTNKNCFEIEIDYFEDFYWLGPSSTHSWFIKVKPKEGLTAGTYTAIVNIKDTVNNVSFSAPVTFTVTNDIVIKVNSPFDYEGTVTGGGTYSAGEKVKISATPKKGYRFDYWIDGGTYLSDENPYEFTATKPMNIQAIFFVDDSEEEYDINVTCASDEGTVSGSGSYKKDTTVQINAIPAAGYRFNCWLCNGNVVSYSAKYSFKATKNTSYKAVFVADEAAISISDATVTGIPETVVASGNEIKPVPEVTLNGIELEYGLDYEVTYSNNYKPGTAVVTITGRGKYKGTINITFKILENSSEYAKENEKKTDASVTYKNEWVNGRWYNGNGVCDYEGILQWKSDSTGWWVEDDLGWYPTSSWQKIDGFWYYFTSSGYMDYSEYRDGCWLNADGSWNLDYSHGTWYHDSTGWWYEDNGWYPSDQYLWIDGVNYYFNSAGYMS